ncbi:MAG: hypothetical protein HZA53_16590 [Planctomycetes bacterium]|nr:hypothetical protein [Planctomycetota bacterium]
MPVAESGELALGNVLVPDPRAFQKHGRTEKPRRSRSVATGAPPTGANLGGAVDTLSMLSASQIRQIGSRRVARALAVPGAVGLYTIVLNNTGSGWQETFLLQVPLTQPVTPAPLLVCFHKFGVSQNDILNRTTFFQEAQARSWFCIAPLGAAQVNFSSLESQINVRAALDYVTAGFAIDPARIYGVGFSMGGGAVTSYAARHLDPNGSMFAAIANHTGGIALPHTYANEPDDADLDDNVPNFGDNLEVPDILDFWYGGAPSMNRYAYLRCSMMDLDPLTGAVAAGTDMSRNLAHVPVLDWLAAGDPLVYLYEQTDEFHKHIQHQNTQNTLVIAPGTVHSWNTLDETAVCNWLSQFTLQLPTEGSLLADDDGTWLRFQVAQDAGGDFTPFTWKSIAATNRFELTATRNLRRLTVDTQGLGLTTASTLTLQLSTADATGDELLLTGFTQAPSAILRDGQPASGVHDPVLHTLRLVETDAATHAWTVVP